MGLQARHYLPTLTLTLTLVLTLTLFNALLGTGGTAARLKFPFCHTLAMTCLLVLQSFGASRKTGRLPHEVDVH